MWGHIKSCHHGCLKFVAPVARIFRPLRPLFSGERERAWEGEGEPERRARQRERPAWRLRIGRKLLFFHSLIPSFLVACTVSYPPKDAQGSLPLSWSGKGGWRKGGRRVEDTVIAGILRATGWAGRGTSVANREAGFVVCGRGYLSPLLSRPPLPPLLTLLSFLPLSTSSPLPHPFVSQLSTNFN